MKRLTKRSKRNLKRGIKIFDVIIISLMLAGSIYLILNYEKTATNAIAGIGYYGLSALFIFTFLFEIIPQFISPDYILLFSIGLGINTYQAVFVTLVASVLGSWLAFLIGYHYGFGAISPLFSEKKLNRILRFWCKHGKWYVLLSGTIPLPIPFIPVIFGALRMSKRDFLLWGIVPRAIGFIATGIVGYYWLGWIINLL